MPSTNSRAYRLLGGAPETEIVFRLPSVRVEYTRAGRHAVCNLTAITPIDAETSEINHCIYWTAPWLSLLKPLLRPYVRAFLQPGPGDHGAPAAGVALGSATDADR